MSTAEFRCLMGGMRVQIDGDHEIVSGLADAFPTVEPATGDPDLTEQKFGFAEVASIVATVQGVVELAKIIVDYARERADRAEREARAERAAGPQTLRLTSAIGTVVVEVTPETSLEDLEAVLAPLAPVRR